ncbi:MAG: DUF86 domain-containing protein [Prevotellaceae bacterium]|jgi:uncharacterized protein with HEPN domain|nr:DUF86 domain-containing protein [Prevotellaceae bacterium]
MKTPISDNVRLAHIIEAIDAIKTFTQNKTIDNLYADSMLRSAVRYQLTVIGEAANNITETTRKLLPQVTWRKIIATRNILIHGYSLVDEEIIWNIIEEKLPELNDAIKNLQPHQ